jgi:tripartite-type tricarboxylate transporter receptor subunit TctC
MNVELPCPARRRAAHRLAVGLASLALPGLAARAQAQAAKPLRIIVAGAAGAAADVAARLFAEALQNELGRPVIVDPRPGAGGTIAVNELLAAPHDGGTVLVGINSLVSEVPHVVRTKVDIARAITPVAQLARGGLVLIATPSLPVATLPELIAYARARRGALAIASYSPGTMSHILGLLLNREAGLDLVHVGYKGSTPALADVMGGHVPLMFDALPSSLPLIRVGKVKALAATTPTRSALLPHVPTFRELGYPGLEASAWLGVWTTPDASAEVQARLRYAALKVTAQPPFRARLAELGYEPGSARTPQDLARDLQADHDRVGALLKSIGFKPE